MKLSGLTYSKPACVMKPKLTLSPRARYGRPGPRSAARRAVAVEKMNRMETKRDSCTGVLHRTGFPNGWDRSATQRTAGIIYQKEKVIFFPKNREETERVKLEFSGVTRGREQQNKNMRNLPRPFARI